MSTVPVYLSYLSSGLKNSAQTLPRSVQAANSCGGALCSAWRGGVDHGVKVLARYGPLGSEWTGSEFRIVHTTFPRSLLQSKKFLAGNRGPIGGLLYLRSVYSANQFNVAPVHHMISAPQRRRSFRDTRLAYGYYIGPAYGYGGGFGSGSILVFIVLGFIVVQTFQSLTSGRSEGLLTRDRDKVTVLKLQVGLLGFARALQNDLERISDQADTSTSRGLHYVLTETVLALLRQPDMCILGTSMAEVKRGFEAGERRFNQLSLEERGKFDEETLVNVDGNRKRGLEKSRGDGFSNEYIVVTLLAAAEGDYSLPAIYDNDDLKEALKTLGSIPADSIQGVEILWTPQDKSDSLSERDLLRNYPLLKSL